MLSARLDLRQRLDALGTQGLTHKFTLLFNFDMLKIRLKLMPGRSQGMAAAITKHRAFAAVFTFSHGHSFLYAFGSAQTGQRAA